MTGTAKVTVDTTEAQRELDQLQENAQFTAATTTAIVQKSYQSIRLLADVYGYAIPIYFDILTTAAIMSGQMFDELAAAESFSVWLAAKATITFSISLMMFYRALQLQKEKTIVEDKLNSVLMLGNVWF